jgi:CheY-like chemotaxis protein
MKRILIIESHLQVRQLLERIVRALGYEPVVGTAPAMPALEDIELVIVEPCDPPSARLAEKIQLADPLIPIICVSVLAEPQVDLVLDSCLLKPFIVADLAAAITRALLRSHERPHAMPGASVSAVSTASSLVA